ncbi:NUDIX domain-containing protein [Pedobacter sp. MC2016-24]|uniref:NUDIX hydrolase n=1 Tax=Pedobacter sp. MC2016-24 TaxID=2780090 RepID=UPI00187DDE03|nr:NUDIX domain-containing protein [Pedobacter sp. MC2016-24]MBE9597798.1 NUDIX domain-containing protein [Pedobacter sp. MC2016-24]
MKSISSGILLYRIKAQVPEVFLVHPGGPFFRNKDQGWWTIPKGEPLKGEVLLATALREFQEETGYLPEGDFRELKPIVQKAGKMVHCWAVAGDLDPSNMTCNTFALVWPPKSGKIMNFPEVDKGAWFSFDEAKLYINGRQIDFLDQLKAILTTG